MLDAQTTTIPAAIRREEYRPPDWLVPDIALDFRLDPDCTRVRSRLSVVRNGEHDRPIRLDCEALTLVSVLVDGAAAAHHAGDGALVIPLTGNAHVLEIEVTIAPSANTQLMGLYASDGLLCTQCEAEGFRRITCFPDRPDILSRYKVRMEADRDRFPVLLANGDRTASGETADGRHWAEWTDPFPKPCYLFALVAGDLAARRDRFTTMSGREVALAIWVREADLPRTAHAMASLKAAMAWDERVYGREYDLDQFNIVAVADFNFGAMENKSLNIFNSRYVLADPETATDADYDAIEAVVAHEYFHNWSGNRVTCRDWFQLSLKEGFTVFRDQQFSADMGSAAVKRIEDVRVLRAAQFPEDAGPLAHPVRPESYMEIANFYTATIYNKGAEVIRMMHGMLGAERFRAGTDLYFERHDGEAATCEDFIRAIEDGGGIDLDRFRLWYEQAGTPRIDASVEHDAASATARLTLRQAVPPTPGQPDKQPMVIPLRTAWFDRDTGRRIGDEALIIVDGSAATHVVEGVARPPLLSINRGFSAPVSVAVARDAGDLALLAAHDDDPFARYEAIQQLMVDTLVGAVSGGTADHAPVIAAVERTLCDPSLDRQFVAEAVLLPSETYIGDQMATVDPDRIHAAREALRRDLGAALAGHWRQAQAEGLDAPYSRDAAARARRRLRSIALGYLLGGGDDGAADRALGQYRNAGTMTDRLGALNALAANADPVPRQQALDDFHARFHGDPLLLDKWFSVQALAARPDVADDVVRLARHRDFTIHNPNRLRSLINAFSSNQRGFHDMTGAGYRLLADHVIAVDAINPQAAARLVPPLGRWRRFDAARQAMMRAELDRILARPGLSRDVYEQASKSLG